MGAWQAAARHIISAVVVSYGWTFWGLECLECDCERSVFKFHASRKAGKHRGKCIFPKIRVEPVPSLVVGTLPLHSVGSTGLR